METTNIRRRRGERNVDYSVKFIPAGILCEERDDTDVVTPCDYFNKTTHKCKLHGVTPSLKQDISHSLRPRLLHRKPNICLSQTMDFSDAVGVFD